MMCRTNLKSGSFLQPEIITVPDFTVKTSNSLDSKAVLANRKQKYFLNLIIKMSQWLLCESNCYNKNTWSSIDELKDDSPLPYHVDKENMANELQVMEREVDTARSCTESWLPSLAEYITWHPNWNVKDIIFNTNFKISVERLQHIAELCVDYDYWRLLLRTLKEHKLPNLTSLAIEGAADITEEDCSIMLQNIPNLENLKLIGIEKWWLILNFIRECATIKYLSFYLIHNTTEVKLNFMREIFYLHQQRQFLSICFCCDLYKLMLDYEQIELPVHFVKCSSFDTVKKLAFPQDIVDSFRTICFNHYTDASDLDEYIDLNLLLQQN